MSSVVFDGKKLPLVEFGSGDGVAFLKKEKFTIIYETSEKSKCSVGGGDSLDLLDTSDFLSTYSRSYL